MADEDGELALVVRRLIRAPVERVFAAWTEPDQLTRWWGPEGVRCCGAEVDLRPGGRYRIGNQLPDGEVVWIVGEFEVVSPPHELRYTWRLGDPADAEPARERVPTRERVTVRFEPRKGGTEVVVVHERIAGRAARERHEAGWIGCLDGLERLFAAPTS